MCLFPFFLIGQRNWVSCFPPSIRIEAGGGKQKGRKEGMEGGCVSELIELHFISDNLRCKILGNFYFLVSEN